MVRYRLSTRAASDHGRERVLIIGAGQAAQEIIKDIRIGHSKEYEIVGLIDDNQLKKNRFLEGVRVLGNRNDIPAIVENEEVDRIIFAINNAEPSERAAILNICKETGCKLLAVPGLYQLYSGEVRVSRLKNVEIDDLLGRSEIKVNNDEILKNLMGKRVMVTGGGGSIGSELCRQIAKANPALLIIFDVYENTTYDIEQELKRNCPNLTVLALIGDVTDRNRVKTVLQRYKPDIIYHAAAHKHVPLMEDSPNEAIKNNVMGTLCVCEEAADAGVKKFLLISTDKAVNPTNIMGASKRLCEMIVQMMNRRNNGTQYVAVRFGNVLGSNGSVIPLFKKQIAAGGPVTVTDPNIIRYFMTIPEAVSLVLQASYYAKGGEIFVLDMGKPVKIDDMARNLIKLSGLKPDVDIEIKYTGLRPGEKLYEELLMDEEGMSKTENDLIYIGHPIEMNDEVFVKELQQLDKASHEESIHIESLVETIVPTYNKFHDESTDEFTKQLEVIVNDQMIAKETKDRLVNQKDWS
jgi:FlaA1/EpsC-like NDP-sugar epimerase